MGGTRVKRADTVRFFLPGEGLAQLLALPWHVPLLEWGGRRVSFLEIMSGLSLHLVRFVGVGGVGHAVKETSAWRAQKELERYRQPAQLGIPARRPTGLVVRDDDRAVVSTASGPQKQTHHTGYLITRLTENVVPDSVLFRRAFSKENRRRIWDAVIRLLVSLRINACTGGTIDRP